jgi:LmbE family N-acetylglucosaminyl deacetylase
MGGLIARQRSQGSDVLLFAVTDGDAAYFPDGDAELAARRRDEQRAAARTLGLPDDAVQRMGIPDSKVTAYPGRIFEALCDVVDRDTLLIAPWALDVHPDHEAVGRVAVSVAEATAATLMSSMFWAWHLGTPSAVPTGSLRSLALTDDEQAAKRHAIECHDSQVAPWRGEPPILDDGLLIPTRWPTEYFVEHRPTGNA